MDAPTTRNRSAGAAFLMSLAVPGSGQTYAGKRLRGGVTFLFFLLSALGVFALNMDSPLWGASLRLLLAVYVFSFLDAYYTAQELHAGKDPAPYQNPRVAAALNLVTNGFGYFYLGERAKGLIVFIAFRLLAAVLGRYQLLWELISLGIAADAYRIGRRALQRGRAAPLRATGGILQLGLSEAPPPPPSPEPAVPAAPIPLSPIPAFVPLTITALIGGVYLGLVVLASVMPDYQVLDQSQATFDQSAEERIYSNPRYGVEFHVPASWNFDISDRGSLIQSASGDGICRAGLLLDAFNPLFGLESGREAIIEKVLGENPNFQLAGQRSAKLGVHPAYEITFSLNLEDDDYLTRYVLARRGMTLYSLVLTNRARFDEDCRRLTDVIRLRLVLPM